MSKQQLEINQKIVEIKQIQNFDIEKSETFSSAIEEIFNCGAEISKKYTDIYDLSEAVCLKIVNFKQVQKLFKKNMKTLNKKFWSLKIY